MGSPPHVRGKVTPSAKNIHTSGITPACAGKRLRPNRKEPARWDHPRMCGEKTFASLLELIAGGSPPHVRGKEGKASRAPFRGGITPACAGKRKMLKTPAAGTWDHPRVCGEKCTHAARQGHHHGITPAYAGKSQTLTSDSGGGRDHPRVCGEKLVGDVMDGAVKGITPAYAGKRGLLFCFICSI